MTFLAPGTSKEELLFPGADQLQASLEEAFAQRGQTAPTLQTLKNWILTVAAQKKRQDSEFMRVRRRIIDSEKSLQDREKLYLSTIETILAREIAKDLGAKEDDITPKMAAAAAIAIFAAIDMHVDQDLSKEEAKELINAGIGFLESGLCNLESTE